MNEAQIEDLKNRAQPFIGRIITLQEPDKTTKKLVKYEYTFKGLSPTLGIGDKAASDPNPIKMNYSIFAILERTENGKTISLQEPLKKIVNHFEKHP